MGALPSEYFQYYYFEDEVLGELTGKPTTRAEDILSWVPGYWEHYVEQARSDRPELDPGRSRGGIHELELAIDCMDAVYNDRGETLPVNVPNQGSIPGFPDTLVVETLGVCDAQGIRPLAMPGLPAHLRGLVEALGEYQQAAADAAWSGRRARRRPRARGASARPLDRHGRAALRGDGRRARAAPARAARPGLTRVPCRAAVTSAASAVARTSSGSSATRSAGATASPTASRRSPRSRTCGSTRR